VRVPDAWEIGRIGDWTPNEKLHLPICNSTGGSIDQWYDVVLNLDTVGHFVSQLKTEMFAWSTAVIGLVIGLACTKYCYLTELIRAFCIGCDVGWLSVCCCCSVEEGAYKVWSAGVAVCRRCCCWSWGAAASCQWIHKPSTQSAPCCHQQLTGCSLLGQHQPRAGCHRVTTTKVRHVQQGANVEWDKPGLPAGLWRSSHSGIRQEFPDWIRWKTGAYLMHRHSVGWLDRMGFSCWFSISIYWLSMLTAQAKSSKNLSQSPFMSHGCFFITIANFDAVFFCIW